MAKKSKKSKTQKKKTPVKKTTEKKSKPPKKTKQQLAPTDRASALLVRLTEWRKKSGLSQSKMAKMLGMSIRTYQGWEQLRRKPSGLSLSTLESFVNNIEARKAA